MALAGAAHIDRTGQLLIRSADSNIHHTNGDTLRSESSLPLNGILNRTIRTIIPRRVTLEHHWYNITAEKLNHYVNYTANGVTADTVLSGSNLPGNWTLAQIVTAVNTILGVNGTCTYSTQTQKVTVTGGGAGVILKRTGSTATNFWTMLGFTSDQIDQAAVASVTGNHVASVVATKNLYLCAELPDIRFVDGTRSAGDLRHTLLHVPVTTSFGDILEYEPRIERHIPVHNELDSLVLRWFDDEAQPVNFNGGNWSVLLDFEYVQ